MTSIRYADGWCRHHYSGIRADYWAVPEEGTGPMACVDGGIGAIQWINAIHDRAVILISDGTWRTGGTFRVWYSAGGGSRPREITDYIEWFDVRIIAGENVFQDQLDAAEALVEAYFGIVTAPPVEASSSR